MARYIVFVLLVITAGYIGYQKLLRNPRIEAGNLREVLVYGEYGREKKVSFLVEVADGPFARQKGLMHRENLPEDQGMLFVYKREGGYPMTMKNTLIPLDMIFIDSSHRVVELVEDAEPRTDGPYGGDQHCEYVLEVNAGSIEEYNIKKGDVVKGLVKKG